MTSRRPPKAGKELRQIAAQMLLHFCKIVIPQIGLLPVEDVEWGKGIGGESLAQSLDLVGAGSFISFFGIGHVTEAPFGKIRKRG